MEYIVVSNNSLVKGTFGKNVEYYETDLIGIMKIVRDYIHAGHELLTHPLSGSIKPNETPFKSVMISKNKTSINFESLSMIENSIEMTGKLLGDVEIKEWPQKILEDFRLIDFSLIEGVIR